MHHPTDRIAHTIAFVTTTTTTTTTTNNNNRNSFFIIIFLLKNVIKALVALRRSYYLCIYT